MKKRNILALALALTMAAAVPMTAMAAPQDVGFNTPANGVANETFHDGSGLTYDYSFKIISLTEEEYWTEADDALNGLRI